MCEREGGSNERGKEGGQGRERGREQGEEGDEAYLSHDVITVVCSC